MKKETLEKRAKITNYIMYYIYKYIDTDINIDTLSMDLNISKFHMHRIFKEEFGKNIYEAIKSIRLQKASTLLITNKYSTITQIASMCGYSSQTSFIRAFKQRFNCTPKKWKNDGYKEYSKEILKDSIDSLDLNIPEYKIEAKIVKMPKLRAYYIRHEGYDNSIKNIWQKLYTWTLTKNIKKYKQIGIYHDNPVITPLDKCQYIACIVLEDDMEIEKSSLPTFLIPDGIYAKFHLEGFYGDTLKFMRWLYHTWLLNSGYETKTAPSYSIYEKNHFLEDDEKFILDYYLPITYV
ncbi:transcriptional regulator, AraC family [Arcobacter nitrofigilis DSM 7299]|uniref:Transcriptional regulator, AraC family n=1 Tax=Arcobacter nitrofigilis (strain ATCC 33309 / DSM 7299 / CCUG 15893 / LMG 7604 / NCTC 12251 / CI) TaxID=572480 RepID=D5V740_ARCNC|nr:GyrI-like domain-containing protein [Arcobacter nitrofigilis]ADG94460.1 transcriptional regulator, AraC family [Arcobacter nitrofigilis DSM 7299]